MDTIASNNWDRTPPKVPILGSDDINSSPYTEKAEDASLYESYLHSKSSTLTGKLDSLTRLRRWLMSFSRPDGLPFSDDVLMEMILEDYPRRSDVLVDVMDFSPTRSERTQQKLQDVSTCKLVLTQHVAYTDFLPSGLHKPQWSTVRWIHAPLGPTFLSAFLEDEVLTRGPRGFPFRHAGSPEFAYFTVEGMSFWSRKAFQRYRDIFARFSSPNSDTNRRLGKRLLRTLWRGELLGAVKRYKGQRGRRPESFWSLAIGELPRDLEEESSHARLGDPHFGAQARRDKLDPQILSKHPYYEMAQTVRSQLRFYHRSDGFVLSMSPPMGIQYLHRDWFKTSISAPIREYTNNTWGSLIPQAFYQLSKGIEKWHTMDENWLMIYLATEMCSLPSGRLGGPGLKPEEAYFVLLQDLKRRRRIEWNHKEAVDLVRDLVDFNDEVNLWLKLLERQLVFLERLGKDAENLEEYYGAVQYSQALRGSGESPLALVQKAVISVEIKQVHMQQIFAESNRVLEALFRLRTIQQNELANSADRSNKAIVAFTIITIIFLPLNFFTSYFAMIPVLTTPGPASSHTLRDFWSVSAPIGVVVLMLSMTFAFRHHIVHRFNMLFMSGKKHHETINQRVSGLA